MHWLSLKNNSVLTCVESSLESRPSPFRAQRSPSFNCMFGIPCMVYCMYHMRPYAYTIDKVSVSICSSSLVSTSSKLKLEAFLWNRAGVREGTRL